MDIFCLIAAASSTDLAVVSFVFPCGLMLMLKFNEPSRDTDECLMGSKKEGAMRKHDE